MAKARSEDRLGESGKRLEVEGVHSNRFGGGLVARDLLTTDGGGDGRSVVQRARIG